MNVSFHGLGALRATFEADEALASAGVPVKLSANGTVTACAAGDVPVGIAEDLRGGYAAVLLRGYVSVPYSGELSLGAGDVLADDGGKIKTAGESAGLRVTVLDLDPEAHVAGILL